MKTFNLLKKRIIIVILAGILFSSVGFLPESRAEETLRWYGYDLPPYHILRGDKKNQGILDYFFGIWKDFLPEYEHEFRSVNVARMMKEMQASQRNSCVTGSFKLPGGSEKRIWSKAIYVEPPAMVVVTKETLENLKSPKFISLEKLLQDPNIIYGHFRGRPYYGNVDLTLEKHLKQKNVNVISSRAGSESIMKLIQSKRIHWGLEFIPELGWKVKGLGFPNTFRTIAIQDHNVLTPVFMNCINNEWGKKIVGKINQVITRDLQQQVWAAYEGWALDERSVELFREAQAQYFSKE